MNLSDSTRELAKVVISKPEISIGTRPSAKSIKLVDICMTYRVAMGAQTGCYGYLIYMSSLPLSVYTLELM